MSCIGTHKSLRVRPPLGDCAIVVVVPRLLPIAMLLGGAPAASS
jgi:hypothetical protein